MVYAAIEKRLIYLTSLEGLREDAEMLKEYNGIIIILDKMKPKSKKAAELIDKYRLDRCP